MSIASSLAPAEGLWHWIRQTPDRCALICPDGQPMRFAALGAHVLEQAAALRAANVGAGDRVVSLLERGPAAVVHLWACWQLGAVWVPLAPTLPAQALEERLRSLQPAALLRPAEGGANLAKAVSIESLVAGEPALAAPAAPLAVLLFTSGSRGRPKAVMLTHDNLAFTASAIAQELALLPEDRIYCALPLHHSYGLYQLWAGLARGACVILGEPVSLGPPLARQCLEHQATVLPATPGLLQLLLSRGNPPALPALRLITQAADSLSDTLAQQVRTAWPHARLARIYGLTECGRVSIESADDRASGGTSVGRPLPGTAVRIVDEQGQALPSGQEGRLWVQGPHVTPGYWQDPALTAATLKTMPGEDAWLDTGDEFVQDADGCLHFRGRSTDVIKCRGERISAMDVQTVLMRHPCVLECTVLGRAHPAQGQRVEAHVVLREGQAVQAWELAEHCRQWLEPAHCPQAFQFHQRLPKNELGKVIKADLLAAGEPSTETRR